MTPSEEYTKNLCENSFLSLWCYPNPRAKDNKELCDVLVVCEPSIIIFSVKEIEFNEDKNFETAYKRWRTKAIEKSVSQIYGAERWITSAQNVITETGERALKFPTENQRIYRIAVAFGGRGQVHIESGDYGKGFVHVFDEVTLRILIQELDTITDFVDYLHEKEVFLASDCRFFLEGGEEDLLAYFLMNDRKFPQVGGTVIITNGLWKEFSQSDKYRNKKRLERLSYAWDTLIEQQCTHFRDKTLLTKHTLDEFESAIRVMAKEDRFNRRVLCEQFFDFQMANTGKNSARIVTSLSGVTYVFQVNPEDCDREDRKAELKMRCMLARGIHKQNKTVIGIATECFRGPDATISYDIVNYSLNEWSDDAQQDFERIQQATGFFKKLNEIYREIHEYRD
jgi:hypothetical protein